MPLLAREGCLLGVFHSTPQGTSARMPQNRAPAYFPPLPEKIFLTSSQAPMSLVGGPSEQTRGGCPGSLISSGLKGTLGIPELLQRERPLRDVSPVASNSNMREHTWGSDRRQHGFAYLRTAMARRTPASQPSCGPNMRMTRRRERRVEHYLSGFGAAVPREFPATQSVKVRLNPPRPLMPNRA